MLFIWRLRYFLALVLCAQSAFATTYYISTSGSDSNNGTSNSTPWLHAPGMTGCSATCASKTPSAGDQFILRGGDSWHYSSAKGTVGLPWTVSFTGTASNYIYFGVDHTWYTGSAWTRPVLNGDNPLSTTAVSSCSSSGDTNNPLIAADNSYYVELDDFELTGECFSGTAQYGGSSYISNFNQSSSQSLLFKNIYIHGWTHTSGADTQAKAFGGPTVGADTIYDSVVVDGSDSDPTFLEAIAYDAYIVRNSVIRYISNGIIGNGSHEAYNNLFEYIYEPDDSNHGNVIEWNNSVSGQNFVFNNVIRNNQAAVNVWVCGTSGNTAFVFNNVFWNDNAGNFYDYDNSSYCGSSFGPQNVFNNTFQGGSIRTSSGSGTWSGQLNSNYMLDTTVANAPATTASEISTTTSTAGTDGYTSSNNFVPTSANCDGSVTNSGCPVGQGSNLAALCNSITDATAQAACLVDGTGGPNYDSVNHRVNGNVRTPITRPAGNWDAGAFQASATTATAPSAPVGLAATAK